MELWKYVGMHLVIYFIAIAQWLTGIIITSYFAVEIVPLVY